MWLKPSGGPGAAVWAHHDEEVLALGVWTEKRPGRGEDAEPLVLHNYAARRGMLAVCDGVGGAGVQTAGRTSAGTERTGAWVSSRGVRLAAEAYFQQVVQFDGAPRHAQPGQSDHGPGPAGDEAARGDTGGDLGQRGAPSLHQSVDQMLQGLRNPARSRIGGTMQRELPSTLAAILYRVHDTSLDIRVRWAGDSRCYLLTSQAGLQQLSRDDSDAADALEALEQDPPMTNQIAADGRYQIYDVREAAELPCMLLCATDGFFNYVSTPAHFEYILLRALAKAADPREWSAALAEDVQSYTQDDASLALVAFGYGDFGQLRATFADRTMDLEAHHWQPFQALSQASDQEIRAARLESWTRYRGDYEQRIKPREIVT